MRKIFLFLLQLSVILLSNAEPLIEISQGVLNGTVMKSRNNRNYSAFLGIPYGKPPVGNLRFKNPQPAEKWSGIRLANSFGSECPQLSEDGSTELGGEDCLFLNVYTPYQNFNTALNLLPVMVFIHGGGYILGSSNYFSANNFLDKQIVLVTMNYRVGIFGFFSTGTLEAPGNFGLKDQVLSLKWVQENIKAFGGDPNRVTLFGNSAGGSSVSLHALSKASNGLFQQYIMQSGNGLASWAYRNREEFIEFERKIASIASCSVNNITSCLRGKSVSTLLKISTSIREFHDSTKFWWKPTNELPEAEDAFLTDSPQNLLEQNQMKDLPFLTGDVGDEGVVTTVLFFADSIFYNSVRSNLDRFIVYAANEYLETKNKTKFVAAVKEFYFRDSAANLTKDEFIEDLTDFLDDVYYHYPEMVTLDKVVSKMKNPVYFYLFSYRGEKTYFPSVEQYRKNGAGHGEELLYLFDSQKTPTDIHMSHLMVDLWTSFATNGKPTSDILENPSLWKPYNSRRNNNILQIGNINNYTDPSVNLSNYLYKNRINFWRETLSAAEKNYAK